MDVFKIPVLRIAPGLKAYKAPEAVIFEPMSVDVVKEFNAKLLDSKSVFV